MPDIKNQSTVEAIAREFCSNGRNQEKALKAVGYSVKYAEHRGAKVLSNVGVKEAIARIDAENSAVLIANRSARQRFWTKTMKEAPNMNDRLRASELLGKSEADFTVNINTSTDEPQSASIEQIEFYKRMAQAATDEQIGPKLAKEA